MILYSVNGIFDTEQNGILIYRNKPGKIKIEINGQFTEPRDLYNDPAGVAAQLEGDLKKAEKYKVKVSDLLLMKWRKRYETYVDGMDELRRRQKAAAAAQEAEMIRKMKKDGTYDAWKRKQDHKDQMDESPEYWHSFANRLISHISPIIHKAGYTFEFYNYNWPNPEVRLINESTGEWDDDGICAGRNGYFNLFDLADLFGDPLASDPVRQCRDPYTGRVLGANPTFDPAKTVPARKITGK